MSRQINWASVAATWRASGRTRATIAVYLYWARRFVEHCEAHRLDPIEHLTLDFARQVAASEPPRRRGRGCGAGRLPIVAVRALSCALAVLGHPTPPWRVPTPTPRLSSIVEAFVHYRLHHRGVALKTRRRDVQVSTAFLELLRARHRRLRTTRVADIDAFVTRCTTKWAPKTVAAVCSTLRAFLAFLHATGRVRSDLASMVVAPRVRSVDRPPRARPWSDVQRILRAVDVHRVPGRRDYALLLLMATYGMGAGEVLGLQLEDIDWKARVLHVRRPKTGVATDLPMLDHVARAIAIYLRDERPAHARSRAVFVSHRLPHDGLSASSAIRHRIELYADLAGIHGGFLGTHLFRFTHATRQIGLGTSIKVIGDVLGHRRPSSTSVYVRGAIPGLRAMALPVPR